MSTTTSDLDADRRWRDRAAAVIPGRMYGHQSTAHLPDGYPQFMARGAGARVWDVDGNEYVDLMCSYGPIILGYVEPEINEAVKKRMDLGFCFSLVQPVQNELEERLARREHVHQKHVEEETREHRLDHDLGAIHRQP